MLTQGQSWHVIVIGAGLGGLCLAQGLRQAGISVAVYERDRAPGIRSAEDADTPRNEGYRIGINPTGSKALFACLPRSLYDLYVATSSDPGRESVTLDHRDLSELSVQVRAMEDPSDPAQVSSNVNRLTLREVLLAGPDDAVHFDMACTGFAREPNGAVRAQFADGSSATGAVLVGADGINSAVRRTQLPQAVVEDLSPRCIYGRTPLTPAVLNGLPSRFLSGFFLVLGPEQSAFVGAAFRPRRPLADAAAALRPGLCLTPVEEAIMWILGAPQDRFPLTDAQLWATDRPALRNVALEVMAGWASGVRRLVEDAEVASLLPLRIRAAAPVAPWATTNVTLLGDAIHAMTPVGGNGANTALRDAQLLCEKLIAVARGETALAPALHDYEAAMLEYGFSAVEGSLRGAAQLQQQSRELPPTTTG